MEEQKNFNQIISAIILALILLSGTGLFFWQAGFFNKTSKISTCSKEYVYLCTTENTCLSNNGLYWWENSCHLNEKPKPALSEYPDYDSLVNMNSFPLVENFNSYTPKSEILEKNITKGIILKNGKISKGYLEIIASINNKPLTTWESIYFKAPYNVVNHYLYGGHIFRPDSLKVPPSDKTHLLFALNNIPFLSFLPYSETAKPNSETAKLNTYDLFSIINENKEVKFLTYISSLTPAKIDLIKLYYECDKDFNNGNCELTKK